MVAYPAREGEDVPTVGLRNIAGDEAAAMSCALYQDAGIRHSRYDAVAAHEVYLISVCTGKEFGEQSALFYHSCRRFPMLTGVEVIQTVSQHAYGFVAVGECLAVRHDIHSVGKSAYDEHVGRELLQVGDEAADEVFAVRRAVAGSHDVDDALLVEVGVAFIEEDEGCVIAVFEALRIAVVVHRNGFYSVAYIVLQFFLSAFSGFFAVLDSAHEFIRGIGEDVSEVVLMLQDERSGVYLSV